MYKNEFLSKSLKILLIPCIYNRNKATIKSCFCKIELTDKQYEIITDLMEFITSNYSIMNVEHNSLYKNIVRLFIKILSLIAIDDNNKSLIYCTSKIILTEDENILLSTLYQEE